MRCPSACVSVSCVCIKLRFLGQQSEKAATDSAVGFFRLKRTGSRCHSSDPPLLPGGFRACGTWWQCGRYAVSVGRPSPAARIAKTLRGVTHFHAPTSGHLSQKRRWQRAGRLRLGVLPVFCRLALAFVGGEGIGDCGWFRLSSCRFISEHQPATAFESLLSQSPNFQISSPVYASRRLPCFASAYYRGDGLWIGDCGPDWIPTWIRAAATLHVIQLLPFQIEANSQRASLRGFCYSFTCSSREHFTCRRNHQTRSNIRRGGQRLKPLNPCSQAWEPPQIGDCVAGHRLSVQ